MEPTRQSTASPLPAEAPRPVATAAQGFVAFKEIHRGSGAWRVRVVLPHDASAVLYPNALRLQARATSAEGRSSFTWSDDARRPGFRVHVRDGQPIAVEILPRAVGLGSMMSPMTFAWPS